MRNVIVLLLVCVSVLAARAETPAEFIQKVRDESVPSGPAAGKALLTLGELAKQKGQEHLGIRGEEDAKSAALGTFEPIVLVQLSALQEFGATSDPVALLTRTGRVMYPVGTPAPPPQSFLPRTAVEVLHRGETWITSSIGGVNYAAHVVDAIANLHLDAAKTIIVEIPSLRLHFIAFADSSGELILVPIVTAPTFGIVKGATRPARAVLSDLVPWAKRHNGYPS